jgi:hypothetical protein
LTERETGERETTRVSCVYFGGFIKQKHTHTHTRTHMRQYCVID